MPIEPVSTISWPAILIGERSERRISLGMLCKLGDRLVGQQHQREAIAAMRAKVSLGPRWRCSRRAMVSSRLSPSTRPSEELRLVNLSMSMMSTVGLTCGSDLARHRHLQPIEQQLAVGKPGQAVVHRIVQQPLVGALDVGDIAQRPTHLNERAVRTRHARRL